MKFFKQFFKPNEVPESIIEINNVGALNWGKESEYWVGEYNGLKFSIAYDGLSRPEEGLSSLVTRTLSNPEFPHNFMSKIRSIAKSQYGTERYEEIDALIPQDIVFQ